MFKNERWSIIGELKTATYKLNAVHVNGKFFITGHYLRLLYDGKGRFHIVMYIK